MASRAIILLLNHLNKETCKIRLQLWLIISVILAILKFSIKYKDLSFSSGLAKENCIKNFIAFLTIKKKRAFIILKSNVLRTSEYNLPKNRIA